VVGVAHLGLLQLPQAELAVAEHLLKMQQIMGLAVAVAEDLVVLLVEMDTKVRFTLVGLVATKQYIFSISIV
jgi:hypothetical protein